MAGNANQEVKLLILRKFSVWQLTATDAGTAPTQNKKKSNNIKIRNQNHGQVQCCTNSYNTVIKTSINI